MHAPFRRLLTLAVLLFWMAPSLGVASTALHVALDHHGHDAEHAEEIAGRARAATHGHHHDLSVPEHGHEASLTALAPLPRPVLSVAAAIPAPLALTGSDERSRLELSPRRGPPEALFTIHRSLLL